MVLLLLALLGSAGLASAVRVAGIDNSDSNQPDLTSQNGNAGIESSEPIVCSLVLQPYSLKLPLNRTKAVLPTATNPPTNYTASLNFTVRNLGIEDVDTPWTLTINSSTYQSLQNVRTYALQLKYWFTQASLCQFAYLQQHRPADLALDQHKRAVQVDSILASACPLVPLKVWGAVWCLLLSLKHASWSFTSPS